MNQVDELVDFAKDQLRVMKGWEGRTYVKRCLMLWEQEYGPELVAKVKAALNA